MSLTTTEIFQKISPALADEILTFLHTSQKQALDLAVQTMASARKLRPVFIQKKTRAERLLWIRQELGRKLNIVLAENLLQAWFLGAESQMLIAFLDTLEIPHDEKGLVDDMPAAVPSEKLSAAIALLFGQFPRERVALYLHALVSMHVATWPELPALLETDPRAALG